jgi:hypothetical protein
MTMRSVKAISAVAGLLLLSGCAEPLTGYAPLIGTMDVACSRGGAAARTPADRKTYPVSLQLLGGYGQKLGGGIVTVLRNGGSGVATAACASSDIRMRLPRGHYTAVIDMTDGPTKSVSFDVASAERRKQIVVHFPTIMAGAPAGRAPKA